MMEVASASGVLPSLQRPRFTTTLKAFTGTDTLFDIDQEYLARKAVLLKKKRQRTVVEVVGHSELARKLVGAWETAPAKVRQAYEDYLKATAELIDGDISSEELQQSASIIFDMLASDFADVYTVHSANEKKKELLALFGHVSSDICFLKTAELAKKLCKWKAENPERFSEIEREGESSASVPEEQPEWGAEVSFRMPSDGTQEWKQLLEEDGLDGGWQTLYTDTVSNSDVAGLRTTGATSRQGKEAANENGVIEKPEGGMTLRYFKQLCDQVVQLQVGAHLSGDELALALARVLDSERSGDEIAGELFDLIGDGGFELIQELLQNRKELTDLMHKALSVLKNEKMVSSAESRMPSYGTQVSVHTSSDKIMGKLRRKEEKRVARRLQHVNGTSDSEGLASIDTFSALIEACDREPTPGIDALIGKGNPGIINFAGTALPQGSARKVFKGYEEIRVPAIPTAALNPDEKLVNISDLDEFAQAAFEGYKTLNRTQSRVFHTAYHTNENILVCAPTGAGKTNIAMTAILHEIGQNIVYGVLQKNRFKIVYVAPMKALAAEVTSAFSKRLAPLGITVKELTGDMQLSKREIEETQMIVTTPEKWDVITRKSSDIAVAALVKLLIIDEVHLLNDDRGPVIETIVARTLRQVETTQNMIRIVGLSATLPNYLEVARFLRVNQDTGLFYFDASYRPVPLAQQYIGVSEPNIVNRNNLMNEICYNKILDAVKHGHQAMVFVHSRKDTVKTARILVEFAQRGGEIDLFINEDHPQYGIIKKDVSKSRNRELAELVQSGFGVHHAGMLRSDRNLTERLFSDGFLKVLVCTATLAWGVNLPAHMVVIKGTQLYDPKAGGFRELGMLDVLQIFGRAGRPQFDTSGEGIIITTHNQLARYLSLMTHQMPIESQFVSSLKDNLNAEVVLGTVSNVREATAWLGYTYLFVRMSSNPLVYGMTWEEVLMDTELTAKRKGLITEAARALDKAKMMRFDEKSGNMYFTDLGRVASHFYVQYRSVETYNEMLKQHMNESEVLHLVAHSSEFENIAVREEEQQELASLMHNLCPMEVRGGPEDKFGKINILIQIYISRAFIAGFSLVADSAYISASLGRIMRALFEICLQRGWCSMAALLLEYCKAVDRRLWPHQHPLRQFDAVLSPEILSKLENRGADMDRLYDMDEKEMGAIINHPHAGKMVMQCVQQFPRVELLTRISPITRTVLQVSLTISPDFTWKDRVHGATERWWIWVEDSENEHIYHSELFTLSKKIMLEGGHTISFTIPIFEPLPSQYYVRAISDSWLQAMTVHTVSFQHLILPELHPPHTELLDLRPLPVSAVGNKAFEGIYKFSHFNPIQTQAFHTLYHTSTNVLLGAPTGSGKTISAELAMMHLFNTQPDMKVIYIAPLKALVRERRENWQKGLMPALGKRMVELTGDLTPDLLALLAADVILCTPEKWDGISRNWQNRKYVTKVGLIVIDEIHLLGADRGPVLEVIVSRMRYISSQTDRPVRFIGLSTALANARDLADWLGIEETGLFNFKPSVRPVPLEVHIQGFPGKFYCPRMNSMNKPAYAAINTHSPLKPVLIFVSSRRQTRLTALDLIQYASADERPRQFLKLSEDEIMMIVDQVSDSNLKHTLQFGIGLHHAGLNERDRAFAEELFLNNKIQILVCTSTLAWGVNLPAHLVIIKGTEYYEGKEKRYIDYPITDVLQMMGRAGRPQFDQYGKAVILVHEPKKSFYKKFLYEPFPVESSLASHLHDHLNAEVASGTITSKSDAIDYLTWTYLFRRLLKNPSYYGVEDNTSAAINAHLSSLVTDALQDLEDSGCLRIDDDETIEPLMAGTIASQYYLNYTTVALFSANIRADISIEALLLTLSGAAEYDELPVRHNEDKLNEALAKEVRLPVDERILDDPHVKTNLLLQAHFSRLELPISDYVTDTKSVLDQSIRILQAMVDIAANGGWLKTALDTMHLLQMVMQGLWWDDSPLQMMPHMDSMILDALMGINITTMPELLKTTADRLRKTLQPVLQASAVSEVMQAWTVFPRIETRWAFEKNPGNGESSRDSLMDITLRRTNARGTNSRAYMPRFPKVKDEGWWLVLGNVNTWELHALKRTSFGNVLRTSFVIPDRLQVQGLTLLLVSDCYLGMDVQYEVTVENSPKL